MVTTEPQPRPVILVVSDESRVGHALVSYLSAATASLTVTGPLTCEALKDPATIEATTVICDLDGCDLPAAFALIEHLSRTGGPSVVALSSRPGIRREALDHGARAVADKSDDVDQLSAIIEAAIQPRPRH